MPRPDGELVLGREQLEKLVYAAVDEAVRSGRPAVPCIIDALERAQQAAPAPAPRPVWPWLEGEGLERVAQMWMTTYNEAHERGLSYDDARRAAYTAQGAYLWRAMVASLPGKSDLPSRTALAALADPYDGGGKS